MPRERRRRERPSRPRSLPPSASAPEAGRKRVATARDWRWRTFPVYFTFAATLFLTSLLTSIVAGAHGVGLIEALGALAFSIGLAHLIISRFVEPRVARYAARRSRPDRGA